jgi:DNA-binding response OmpR family regulator
MVAIYKYYDEDFILEALDNGVDDCISILCSRKLFLAKIKNIIKRFYKNFDVIRYKDITFTSNNNNFYLRGTSLELTKLEKQLLLEFLKNANKILSRDSLLENVWSENFNIQLRTVNVAVKRLRDKINLYMGDDYIKSVRGQGYLFS